MNEVKNLFVSSRNRDPTLYPSGNNYVLHLTNPIKDIHRVELLTCSVPNTLYNIIDGSNIMTIEYDTSVSTSNTYTYNIPPGFYSGSGLANEIRAAIYLSTDIEVIYKGNEGKFFFKRNIQYSGFTITFLTNEIARIFGFTSNPITSTEINNTGGLNVQYPSANTIPLYQYNENLTMDASGAPPVYWNYLKSNVVANLNPNDGIFLDISELKTPFNEDCKKSESQFNFYSGQNISRTFGLIPMDVSSGAIKNFKKETDYDLTTSYPNPISSLDRVTIQWLDKDGHRVNFNGAEDNSFILRFHTLRRSL